MRLAMRIMQIIGYFSAVLGALVVGLVLIYSGDVDLAYGPSESLFVIRAQAPELYGGSQLWPLYYLSLIHI